VLLVLLAERPAILDRHFALFMPDWIGALKGAGCWQLTPPVPEGQAIMDRIAACARSVAETVQAISP
jgi:hypothetical protein